MFLQQLIALQTVVYKEMARFARIWIQTIVPPIITTALYFIIFGHVLGRFVPEMLGYSYIDFIVPGLVMMVVINNSFANVASSFFSAKIMHHIEELLVSPIPNVYILLGYISGGVIRGIFVGIIVYIVAGFFTDIFMVHPFLMFFILFLSATMFSLAGFINGIMAKKFDDVTLFPTFILGPLTYLGGVFYSIDLLPDIWQRISYFNPILQIVNGFRYASLGVSDIEFTHALGMILGMNLVLFLISLHMLNRGYGLRH